MLIRFSVSNFRSIKERQVLDMRAVKAYTELSTHCIHTDGYSNDTLKSMAIYGANGSGKSTLIKALIAMDNIVLSSANLDLDTPLKWVVPFAFDEDAAHKDSEFEIEFIEDQQLFQYGFKANSQRITEEWLFVSQLSGHRAKPAKWFHRVLDDYYFPNLKGEKKSWQMQTRPNTLFLSIAVRANSESLRPVYNWFQNKLSTVEDSDLFRIHAERTSNWIIGDDSNPVEEAKRKLRILTFMKNMDCGRYLSDIFIKKEAPDASSLPANIPDSIRKIFLNRTLFKTYFIHPDIKTGKSISLELPDESSGTQTLYGSAISFLHALDKDKIFIIDELDTSLHPLIIRAILETFQNQSRSAQIIFSTHDVSLLSNEILRRDQVLLVEKENQQTTLIPLSNYAIRQGESLEKGYMVGRYGAIPLLTTLLSDSIKNDENCINEE